MIIKNEITVGDLISIAGFITATFGLFLAYYQMVRSNRHKRAEFVMDACRQFTSSEDLQEIYYKLEYGQFTYSNEFHGSLEEKTLDKLLMLFENVSKLFKMDNISLCDLDIIAYYFLRVYENKEIGKYFDFLDLWCVRNNLPKRYSSFRKVCEILRKGKGMGGRSLKCQAIDK